MPETIRVNRRSMWSSAMKLSGRMTRSTEECEMSRSCQSALFSNAAPALARSSRAMPDDLLAADRVALVRHRRRALLALGKRLLDLANLGLLKAADLQRELLERRTGNRQRRQQLGMAVALDHLRRDRRRLQAERAADVGFDRWRQVCEGADGARQLADRDDLARAANPGDVARQLRVPQCQLQAERHRLRMHAVRAADHRRAAVFLRPRAHGLHETVEIRRGARRTPRASAAPARCR